MTDSVMAAVNSQLEELREMGVDRFDPVQFRYLESLSRRLESITRPPTANQRERLEQAVGELRARFEQARSDAEQLARESGSPEPWQQLIATGDFRELSLQAKRHQQRRTTSPLTELIANLLGEQQSSGTGQPSSALDTLLQEANLDLTGDGPSPARRELKALSGLKETWAMQALEQRIADAIEQTPADAGPMNPHRLVTRAIKQMQQLSPAYLHQFASHIDTLMTLEKLGRKN